MTFSLATLVVVGYSAFCFGFALCAILCAARRADDNYPPRPPMGEGDGGGEGL